MNILWVGLAILIAVVIFARSGIGSFGADSVAAREKIKQGAVVIDVRTPEEYASGCYKGATNIPLQELKGRLAEVDKKKAVVVYCASGMRSTQAAKILTAAGFQDVTNGGGLRDLEQKTDD